MLSMHSPEHLRIPLLDEPITGPHAPILQQMKDCYAEYLAALPERIAVIVRTVLRLDSTLVGYELSGKSGIVDLWLHKNIFSEELVRRLVARYSIDWPDSEAVLANFRARFSESMQGSNPLDADESTYLSATGWTIVIKGNGGRNRFMIFPDTEELHLYKSTLTRSSAFYDDTVLQRLLDEYNVSMFPVDNASKK